MRARVRDDFPYSYPVTSCGGKSFFKNTWTVVPAGMEREVLDNPYLEAASEEELELDKPVMLPPEPGDDQPLASKAAVALAEAEGVDLKAIAPGSGKDGAITIGDVREFLEARAAQEPEPPEEVQP
jgi:pyruvate/2-oxoglutarate dehydrogenase complex dihydrolipoamide acyltransferase (E2) component